MHATTSEVFWFITSLVASVTTVYLLLQAIKDLQAVYAEKIDGGRRALAWQVARDQATLLSLFAAFLLLSFAALFSAPPPTVRVRQNAMVAQLVFGAITVGLTANQLAGVRTRRKVLEALK